MLAGMIRQGALILALAAGAAGCETASGSATPGAVSDAELVRLAGEVSARLDAVGPGEAGRLRPYELELRRLSDALGGAPASGSAATASAAGGAEAPTPAFEPPAPPDLAGARSLMHAVRLGVYPSRDAAEAGWMALAMIHAEALGGRAARIEDAADGFILKSGPFDDARSAEATCERLKAAGARCGVSDFTGDAF